MRLMYGIDLRIRPDVSTAGMRYTPTLRVDFPREDFRGELLRGRIRKTRSELTETEAVACEQEPPAL